MRTIPVDTSPFQTVMAAGVPAPRIKDRETGELRTDSEGRTVYQVPVLVIPVGSDGEVIRVSVPGEPAGVSAGVHLSLRDLVAVPWNVEGRDGRPRSGVAFRASAVEAVS